MTAPPQLPLDWKDFWDIVAHIGTVIGLLAAGVWAYFNFIKSRMYYPRLELAISGEIVSAPERQFVIPRVTLKNIGLSKVQLIQRGTGYRIWTIVEGGVELRELQWTDGHRVYEILQEHKWIEPGESVFDETRIFSLPPDCIAVKIQARLVAQVWRLFKKNAEWNCSAILHRASPTGLGNPK
jgi:hypothetical protein